MNACRAVAVFAWAGLALAVEVPRGARIEIRLQNKVSTTASKAKDRLDAVVIQPVMVGDQVLIPAGAKLRGEVVKVQPSPAVDKRAELELKFTELAGAGGKNIKLSLRLVEVDNARESVGETGQILGILASETLSARMDQGLAKMGQRASGLAEILQLAKNSVLKTTDSEIVYEPGVEMTLELTGPAQVTQGTVPGMALSLEPVSREDELIRLVNRQPFQTRAEKPPKPSDMTNLMFIGSRQQLESAFVEAGWATAAGLSKQSQWETFRAIAELRGYKEAPMSVLLLDGAPADFNFQKQNNTFAQRHHLRIWHRPEKWDGQDVWVSSSTHDTGIDFSQENRTFIHKIDPEIDKERAKVVSDLLFTSKVRSLAAVERPEVPRESMNATGDRLLTDGRMAVLMLR